MGRDKTWQAKMISDALVLDCVSIRADLGLPVEAEHVCEILCEIPSLRTGTVVPRKVVLAKLESMHRRRVIDWPGGDDMIVVLPQPCPECLMVHRPGENTLCPL